MSVPATRPLDVFIVAGEESGDVLASALMRALSDKLSGHVTFRGIGGHRMESAGLVSQFPMDDLTAMGFGQVIGKLPTILRRMRQTVDAIVAKSPDVLILVDAPDFTHRVAKRVRKRLPDLAIIKYVAPTVWAWRPGRAKAMRGSFDHVLAILPFEPEVMARLGGPPTSYVGHPLLSELPQLRPDPQEAERRESEPPLLLVLPGSRRQELAYLAPVFGQAIAIIASRGHRFELVLPTLKRLEDRVREATRDWAVQPRIVSSEAEKFAAFRSAHAALAASGTVTLELALAKIPMIAAYLVPAWEAWIIRQVIQVDTVILTNIVLGEKAVPELLQQDCVAGKVADALDDLLGGGGASRREQMQSFERLDALMSTGGVPAEMRAADIVLSVVAQRSGRT